MAHKQKAEKIDWLSQWEDTFDWSGQTEKQIHARKLAIEKYLCDYLTALDSGQKTSQPGFKGHTIKFEWFNGPDSQFILSAYLTPSATEKMPDPGSGKPQLSPTPPPQP